MIELIEQIKLIELIDWIEQINREYFKSIEISLHSKKVFVSMYIYFKSLWIPHQYIWYNNQIRESITFDYKKWLKMK